MATENKGLGVRFGEYDSREDDEPRRNVPSILSDVSVAEAKKIRRKVDIRLVLLVGFMYTVSLMDRTNLGQYPMACYNFDL
jgi:hypothetical protein